MSLDEQTKKSLLKNISLSGVASEENRTTNPIIGNNNHNSNILNSSSGLPKIRAINKFNLILSTPTELAALSPFEIRCCLCRSVISYPCWHHSINYVVNSFHYFICFNSDSPMKPSTKCYKRDKP